MTHDEIRAAISASPELLALAQIPDTTAIAEALSVGRVKIGRTEVGPGTIMEALGVAGIPGGEFLDSLEAIGQVDRDVHWTMALILDGKLRLDLPATRAGMNRLATAVPTLAPAMAVLMRVGEVPDPIPEFDVRCAIFADDGTLRV